MLFEAWNLGIFGSNSVCVLGILFIRNLGTYSWQGVQCLLRVCYWHLPLFWGLVVQNRPSIGWLKKSTNSSWLSQLFCQNIFSFSIWVRERVWLTLLNTKNHHNFWLKSHRRLLGSLWVYVVFLFLSISSFLLECLQTLTPLYFAKYSPT